MESVLKTNGVIKKFGNNTILNGINMNINKGDIYGFIGKNGSGKTTFMRVVLSLTQKNDGEVVFFNDKKIENVGSKFASKATIANMGFPLIMYVIYCIICWSWNVSYK